MITKLDYTRVQNEMKVLIPRLLPPLQFDQSNAFQLCVADAMLKCMKPKFYLNGDVRTLGANDTNYRFVKDLVGEIGPICTGTQIIHLHDEAYISRHT